MSIPEFLQRFLEPAEAFSGTLSEPEPAAELSAEPPAEPEAEPEPPASIRNPFRPAIHIGPSWPVVLFRPDENRYVAYRVRDREIKGYGAGALAALDDLERKENA